jgi:hypothetical protein
LEDLGIDGRIISRWIFRNRAGGMDWFDLAQDRDRWQALVNAVNFLTSDNQLASQGLCSME